MLDVHGTHNIIVMVCNFVMLDVHGTLKYYCSVCNFVMLDVHGTRNITVVSVTL